MSAARRALVAAAERILSGDLSLHDGCNEIALLSGRAQVPEDDSFVNGLIGVASELDDVPRGTARAEWNPIALAEKDRERDEYLDRSRAFILAACRHIIAAYR